MDLLRKLSRLFNHREKQILAGLCALILVGGVLDTIGIGIILPFIGLISNPTLIERNRYAARLYAMGHFTTHGQFIFWCGMGIVALFTFKNLFLGVLGYLQNLFFAHKEVSLSKRLLEIYLYQPYTFHLNVNSAELLGKLKGTGNIFNLVLMPAIIICTESFVLTLIILMLLVVEPVPALVALGVFGTMIVVFYRTIRKKLKTLGFEQYRHAIDIYKWINQAFGAVKETRVLGTEPYFVESFSAAHRQVTLSLMWTQFLSQTPRLFTETVVVACIIVVTCLIYIRSSNPAMVIPTLGLFAMAAVRMMPSLNRIVSNIAVLRVSKHVVDVIASDVVYMEPTSRAVQLESQKTFEPLGLRNSIRLENISYRYPATDRLVLQQVALTIPKGTSVGLIGPSGSGKTTLADIVLGLLTPTSGAVQVDGVDISENIRAWQKSLGYIPQTIYLTDDSIRRNIALGVNDQHIDETAVWAALHAAQLDDFVRALPQGLDTEVGERGVRISGGQRQRIGIARALYHNPDVLVLDEATSALDQDTEREVSAAIDSLGGHKTLIIIAHRLSTARKCDMIYKIVDGKIATFGSFAQVVGDAVN